MIGCAHCANRNMRLCAHSPLCEKDATQVHNTHDTKHAVIQEELLVSGHSGRITSTSELHAFPAPCRLWTTHSVMGHSPAPSWNVTAKRKFHEGCFTSSLTRSKTLDPKKSV